jgi:Flp pilus assembly protein TadG
MVEFALVFPIAMVVLLGLLTGSFLFFQNSAVSDAARGGSRWATIETGLSVSGTAGCGSKAGESAQPDTIVNQVKKSANILPVNSAPLCASSATEMQQTPLDLSKANIVVEALPSLANPVCVTISVTYVTKPFSMPFAKTLTMSAHSSSPMPSSGGNVTCPAPGTPH